MMLFDVSFVVNGYTVRMTGDVSQLDETVAAIIKLQSRFMSLPQASPSPSLVSPSASPSASTSQTVTIPVEMVTRLHDGKAEQVRVFGGQWSKFGVLAYPDSCRGLETVPKAYGQHTLPNMVADVLVVDGKPKRVIAIRPEDFPF